MKKVYVIRTYMKALIQRVKRASVSINNELYSKINAGLLVFLGVEKGDTEENGSFVLCISSCRSHIGKV